MYDHGNIHKNILTLIGYSTMRGIENTTNTTDIAKQIKKILHRKKSIQLGTQHRNKIIIWIPTRTQRYRREYDIAEDQKVSKLTNI